MIAPTWYPNRERDVHVTKIIAPGIEFRFFKMEGILGRTRRKRMHQWLEFIFSSTRLISSIPSIAIDGYKIIFRMFDIFLHLTSTSPLIREDVFSVKCRRWIANAYRMNGPPLDIRKRRNSRRSSRLTPVSFSPVSPLPPLSSPGLPSLFRLSLILSMNLPGCRWWAEIRGLLKLNPCTSSCSPRAGRPVRPEATHQERLIAEKITLLNTLPGQCFFSPVATCFSRLPFCLGERATTRHR